MLTNKEFYPRMNSVGSVIDAKGRDGLAEVIEHLQTTIGAAQLDVSEHETPQGASNDLRVDLRKVAKHLEDIEVYYRAIREAIGFGEPTSH